MRNVTVMRACHATATDAFLDVEGARLRYRDEGNGPAIVLLHGWALDLDMWQPQVDELAPRFRLVRFDRRGFGASSGVASIDDDVRDLRILADHLGLARFALLGMSQAARVALQAAASALRARLTCLVLDGAPASSGRDGDETPQEIPLAHYRALVRRDGVEAFRREWSEHPFTRLYRADPAARRLLARITARYPAADLMAAAPAARPAGQALPVGSLRIATLVINGELDTELRRSAGAALCHALPQAERAVIPGCGHLPNLDSPRDYDAVLERFVTRRSA